MLRAVKYFLQDPSIIAHFLIGLMVNGLTRIKEYPQSFLRHSEPDEPETYDCHINKKRQGVRLILSKRNLRPEPSDYNQKRLSLIIKSY